MGIPVNPGAVFSALKEVRSLTDRPLLVAGTLAEQLARELSAGGDASAVHTGGAPQDVQALLYVIGDEVTEEDEGVLKLAYRARVPTIVIAAGRNAPPRVPFVLATDVVRVEPGHGFPIDEIARAVAGRLGGKATPLARRLPLLRPAVCANVIASCSRKNGLIAAAPLRGGGDLPVLTLNQIRMVFRICAAHGLEIDAQRVPEAVGTIGAGLGFRILAREVLGIVRIGRWAVKGLVAYGGTRAIGEATVRYCEARAATQQRQASASASSS